MAYKNRGPLKAWPWWLLDHIAAKGRNLVGINDRSRLLEELENGLLTVLVVVAVSKNCLCRS